MMENSVKCHQMRCTDSVLCFTLGTKYDIFHKFNPTFHQKKGLWESRFSTKQFKILNAMLLHNPEALPSCQTTTTCTENFLLKFRF